MNAEAKVQPQTWSPKKYYLNVYRGALRNLNAYRGAPEENNGLVCSMHCTSIAKVTITSIPCKSPSEDVRPHILYAVGKRTKHNVHRVSTTIKITTVKTDSTISVSIINIRVASSPVPVPVPLPVLPIPVPHTISNSTSIIILSNNVSVITTRTVSTSGSTVPVMSALVQVLSSVKCQ